MNKEHAAVHEAGHAVVGESIGGDIEKVSIVEANPGSWPGTTIVNLPPDPIGKAAYFAAGTVAEEVVFGSADYFESQKDREEIAKIAYGLVGYEPADSLLIPAPEKRKVKQFIERAYAQAREAVQTHMDRLKEIQVSLLKYEIFPPPEDSGS